MATHAHTTPTRRTRTRTVAPPDSAGPATRPDISIFPSPFAIGQQLKLLRDEIDRLDNAQLRLPPNMPDSEPGGRHDLEAAERLAEAREDALRDLIATLPARDIKDAAVQLYEAWSRIDGLNADEDDLEADCQRLNLLLLSAIPVVAAAAGLELDQLGVAVKDYGRRAFALAIEEGAR